MSDDPATPNKSYTAEQVRSMHEEEAQTLGWRCVVNSGEVKGDLLVSIMPPATRVSYNNRARMYLYRHNILTGQYTLVQKKTD